MEKNLAAILPATEELAGSAESSQCEPLANAQSGHTAEPAIISDKEALISALEITGGSVRLAGAILGWTRPQTDASIRRFDLSSLVEALRLASKVARRVQK
jgi:hypothetical protein